MVVGRYRKDRYEEGFHQKKVNEEEVGKKDGGVHESEIKCVGVGQITH